MSAPTQMNEPGLSRREEMSVSGEALSQAPWTGAAVTGGIVALGDFGWHVIGGSFGLGGLNDALSLVSSPSSWSRRPVRCGAERSGRAIRWARANPWRFALLPGRGVRRDRLRALGRPGGGIVGGVLAGLWHGAVAFGLTGAAGTVARSRRRTV